MYITQQTRKRNRLPRQKRRPKMLLTYATTPPLGIVPPRMIVCLPYADALNRAVAAPIDTYQWNLNSIFDPNRTGIGHQPLGHDQWAAFYNRYRVIAVRVRADVVNDSSSVPVKVTLAGTNGSSTLTGINSSEQQFGQMHIVGTSQGNSVKTFDFRIDLAKLNGKTPQQYTSSDVTNAVFGTSPTELMVLNLYSSSLNGSNVAYSLVVRLDFIVELSDSIELTES